MKAISLVISGKTYTCKPTFEVVEAIENATGKGTLQLVREIINGSFKMSDLVLVISCMVSKKNREATIEKIASEVMGHVKEFSQPVVLFLMECTQGSSELETDEPVEDGGSEGNA